MKDDKRNEIEKLRLEIVERLEALKKLQDVMIENDYNEIVKNLSRYNQESIEILLYMIYGSWGNNKKN